MVKNKKILVHNGKRKERLAKKINKKDYDEVHIHSSYMQFLNIDIFNETQIKYLHIDKIENDFSKMYIFEKEFDESRNDIIDINKFKNVFINPYIYDLRWYNKRSIESLVKMIDKLSKLNIKLPLPFTKKLIDYSTENSTNFSFKYFKNEILSLPLIQKYINANIEDVSFERMINNFFTFAFNLGCFSKEKVTNKYEEKTNVVLGQKASSLLANLLKTEALSIEDFSKHNFKNLIQNPSYSFVKFLSVVNSNKQYENLNLIKELSKEDREIFAYIISNFDRIQNSRTSINKDGKPFKRSWEETIRSDYIKNKYVGITEDNKELAAEFASKGISQSSFDSANEVFKTAEKNNIKEHILKVHLKEKTICEEIEEIKKQTNTELSSCEELISKKFNKLFTYEFLSKKDPKNAIIGAYASCCASITSQNYGRTIAEASITSNNIQNIVVRNHMGEIVAKGTLYVDKKLSYGVINDFEINERYRSSEIIMQPGKYEQSNTKEELQRQKIFNAFMRAIKAFVKEYDKENPRNPIQQINIGMGYNRLKSQVRKFPRDYDHLDVPSEFMFNDTLDEQRILYSRNDKSKIIRDYFENV